MWRSCARSCDFAKCFRRTKIYGEKSTLWKSVMTQGFKQFSRPFARCWRLRFPRKKRSDFTPKFKPLESQTGLSNLNVSIRKHVIYRRSNPVSRLEKTSQFRYTLWVVDSQKNPTDRHVHHGYSDLAVALRARSARPGSLEKRTCEIFRRGTVFAASRCAGRDGAGTLRAPIFASESKSEASAEFLRPHGTEFPSAIAPILLQNIDRFAVMKTADFLS